MRLAPERPGLVGLISLPWARTATPTNTFEVKSMSRSALRFWYMCSVALAGVAVTGYCAYSLPLAQLDLRLGVLVLITVIIGSRITIPIPRAKGHISVSDTFIFLTMLLFGAQAAV